MSSFGEIISEARKRLGISQKELAAKILKENDEPISPQYLNDLERNRRNPPSELIIDQFAKKLELDKDHLLFVAGSLPEDIHRIGIEKPETIREAFDVFRRAKKGT